MPREFKTKPTFCRFTPSERKLIEKQADRLNLLLSEYIRMCVLNDLVERQKAKVA